MEFKADEAAVAGGVLRMLGHGQFVQVGIGTSVGVHNAPLFDYLMAIPLTISSDPRLAVAAIALANVGAVLVTFALGRRLWGSFAGTIAGVLFAVAPWAVAFSRKLWEQDLEPSFAAVCLYALFRAQEGSAWWAAGAVTCWAWMAQLHPSAVLLAPLFLLAGPTFWCVARRPPMLAGLLLGVAPLMPYVVYNAAHGWPDLGALGAVAAHPATIDGMAWQAAFSAVTGLGTREIESVPFDHFLTLPSLAVDLSVLATAALMGALLLAAFVSLPAALAPWQDARQSAACRLLLGWLIIPVVLATRHSMPVYAHYELTALPASFLLLGFAATFAAARLQPAGLFRSALTTGHRAENRRGPAGSSARCATVLLILAVIVGGWTALIGSFLRALPPQPFVWDYGVPYSASVEIADIGRRAAGGGRLWQHTDQVIQPMLQYLLRDVPDRRELPPGVLVLPPSGQPAGYLIDDVHDAEVQTALQQAGGTPVGNVVYMDSLHQAMAYTWPSTANPGTLTAQLRPLTERLTNGVQFLGYGVDRPTPALLRVEYVWHVGTARSGVTEADLALYTHLVATDGKNVAQNDGMPFPSAQWQAGETIAAWFDLPLRGVPSGVYHLRAGMYRRPSMQRIPALADSGAQRDGEFPLGTITIGSTSPTIGS